MSKLYDTRRLLFITLVTNLSSNTVITSLVRAGFGVHPALSTNKLDIESTCSTALVLVIETLPSQTKEVTEQLLDIVGILASANVKYHNILLIDDLPLIAFNGSNFSITNPDVK